jgi:gliding motility-associated-like protein
MKIHKLFLFGALVLSFRLFAQDAPPEISVIGEQYYCSDTPMNIVTSVSITDPNPEDTTLQEVFIQIAEGYELGEDTLVLSGVHPNISSVWNAAQGQLALFGPATFAEFESAIEDVLFQTTQTNFTQDRQFSINLGNANYLPSTGHYYFYVSSPGITWTQARDAAANQDYYGLTGYLATITSEEEVQLTGEQTSGTGWIGASDAETEGTWKWETGPEAGTVFWQGTANGNSVNGEFSYWNSGEPNNAGDEDYAHITSPSIGILGSWNDLAVTGDTNPGGAYHPQGYIVEFGGLPNEPEINLSAYSTIIMPRILSEDVSVCGTEQVTINIESSTNQADWYTSETSIIPVYSGLSYDVMLTESTTFWIDPSVLMCSNASQRFPVTVTVNPIPSVNNITIVQCEDEVIDGSANFNLSEYNDAIVSGDLSNIEVAYYSDADFLNQIDDQSYVNTVNNQTVFVVATNTITQCSNQAEVLLVVNTESSQSVTLEACDSLDETGLVSFDLMVAETVIYANEGFDKEVEGFYETYNDALLLQNPLNINYTNNQPYYQVIYARVQQDGNCHSIVEVVLNVKPLPELLEDETVFYCLNTFPETISLYGGIVNDVPNNYYYNWSTGETTINIDVNEPGTYTVDVTRPNGCTNQRVITVLASNTATIETIEITDISENNTITILASGEGEYLYALDDENGPYQESNTFEDVVAGVHTVYIKDIKADCGIVSEDISVLGFPKFFTPNGDTVNDTWQISGFSSQFPVTASVRIFNRFGKLITILNESNSQWDGTYNGKVLPSDDYWFEAKLADGRTFTGHFALKR